MQTMDSGLWTLWPVDLGQARIMRQTTIITPMQKGQKGENKATDETLYFSMNALFLLLLLCNCCKVKCGKVNNFFLIST